MCCMLLHRAVAASSFMQRTSSQFACQTNEQAQRLFSVLINNKSKKFSLESDADIHCCNVWVLELSEVMTKWKIAANCFGPTERIK